MHTPTDYAYWADAVKTHPELFRTPKAFKYELSMNRERYRQAGVILEIQLGGTGERSRVLVSPSAYIDYWRGRAKGRAA